MLILSWNCQGGLNCKIDEVKILTKKYLPHIFFINESEIDPTCDLGYFEPFGPVIFNLYMNRLPDAIQSQLTVSYADDTYVVVAAEGWDECKVKVQTCMTKHMEFLSQRGMICNKEKTELMTFMESPELNITMEGNNITPKTHIKALGITLDMKLSWTKHIEALRSRLIRILNGLKIIRKKFTRKQFKKIVTSQVYGILYYASVVWLNPELSSSNIKSVERLHYATCRMMVGDWRTRWSRMDLNKATERMTPKEWMNYSASNMIIKLERCRLPTNLWQDIEKNLYFNRRYNNPKILDKSTRSVGKKNLANWSGRLLEKVSFDWFNKALSDDTIRLKLKEAFSVHRT